MPSNSATATTEKQKMTDQKTLDVQIHGSPFVKGREFMRNQIAQHGAAKAIELFEQSNPLNGVKMGNDKCEYIAGIKNIVMEYKK